MVKHSKIISQCFVTNSSTVVEYLPQYPKGEGSNQTSAADTMGETMTRKIKKSFKTLFAQQQ
jgi:hypothetical protein